MDVKEFFDDVMYKIYTNLNHQFLNENQELKGIIEQLPDELPKVGMVDFDDNRKQECWRNELYRYLGEDTKVEESKKFFDYTDLLEFIQETKTIFFQTLK